jgi:type IV secretion system protein VirD4
MRSVMLFMGGLARFFYRLIATPVLLGWMIGRTAFGGWIPVGGRIVS